MESMQEGTIGKVAVCSNNARRRTLVSTIFLLLMQRKRTNYTFFSTVLLKFSNTV